MTQIGAGSYGVVFAHGDGEVAKYGHLKREFDTGRALATLDGNEQERLFVVLKDRCKVTPENGELVLNSTRYTPSHTVLYALNSNELWMGRMSRADGDVDMLSKKWDTIFLNIDPAHASEMALCALANVADGLLHMHANGFIHMDVKPHNVLYNYHARRLELKLSDFGRTIQPGDSQFPNPWLASNLYFPHKFAKSDDMWNSLAGNARLSAELRGDSKDCPNSLRGPIIGRNDSCPNNETNRLLGIACDWFGFGCVVDKIRSHLMLTDAQGSDLSNFFSACALGNMSDNEARRMLPLCGIVM